MLCIARLSPYAVHCSSVALCCALLRLQAGVLGSRLLSVMLRCAACLLALFTLQVLAQEEANVHELDAKVRQMQRTYRMYTALLPSIPPLVLDPNTQAS